MMRRSRIGRLWIGRFASTFLIAGMIALAAPAFAQHGSVVANSAGQSPTQASSESPETKFEVPDAIRRSILFTKYALDVRLETRDATMHARAIVTVKNESATALDAIPLPERFFGGGDADLFARVAGTDYYAETSVGEFLIGSLPDQGQSPVVSDPRSPHSST